MWRNHVPAVARSKIRVVDGVLDGEVGLELHVNNKGKSAGGQEDITDDDVFKELVNIVMDVFSNKSEKCLLTFELPVESAIVKEIPPPDDCQESGSEATTGSARSKIVIPVMNAKFSRKFKNKSSLKAPIAKQSKHSRKRTYKKKLNPLVQLVLQDKQGFTDLERLFMMNSKQSQKCHDILESWELTRPDAWKQFNAPREELLQADPDLHDKMSEETLGKNPMTSIYREFKEILNALDDLASSQEYFPEQLFSREMSHHLEGIQSHVCSIRRLLNTTTSPSLESSEATLQWTSTASSEAPIRKNRVGVKVIRIGTKIGRKSNLPTIKRSVAPRNDEPTPAKSKKERSLNDILNRYQRVKKEETEIVKLLLGKLGIDKENHERKNIIRPSNKFQMPAEIKEVPNEISLSGEENIETRIIQNPKRNDRVNKITALKTFEIPSRNMNQMENLHTAIPHHEPNQYGSVEYAQEGNTNDKDMWMSERRSTGKYKKKTRSNSIARGDKSTEFSGNEHKKRNNTFKKLKREPVVMKNCPSNSKSEEDKMMTRIRSATDRLEHVYRLVEKKLAHSSKQDRRTKKSRSKKWDKFIGEEGRLHVVLSSPLESTSVTEELATRKVNLGETKELRGDFQQEIIEEKMGEWHAESATSESEIQVKLDKEETQQTHRNIVCNYVMSLDEREQVEFAGIGSFENEGVAGDVTTSLVHNESQIDGNVINKMKNTATESPLTPNVKENYGEIIEESLLASPVTKARKTPSTVEKKMKKRIDQNPSCTIN